MNNISFDEEKYKALLHDPSLSEHQRTMIEELLQAAGQLSAENRRLRRTLLRVSSSGPRMSTKLKDALYE
ncbi:hypothetical protein [Paenibacillus lentus]|uniref:Uncharacterized protein n=1 Tax=Paenibacillus lentus TaxID=1338368 RepID=A0A3S8RVS3_9BACL|nr:hypothetical protein [Paenibacillus lentus]AZK47078.1 hypothetical protein EIM92_13705 [Paenibacillus lentus]